MSFGIRSLFERRSGLGWPSGAYPSDGSIPSNAAAGSLSAAGGYVDVDQAMRVGAVYSCVSLICDSIGMLPIDAVRKKDGARTTLDSTPPLLAQLHPEMENIDWVGRMVSSLLLRGNAYGLITVDSSARAESVLPVHPDFVRAKRRKDDGVLVYEIRDVLTGAREEHRPWPYGPVLHVRGLTWAGSLEGLSVIDYARTGIMLSLEAEEFGHGWFRDGAAPSSVLESDQKVDAADARELVARWVESHGGRRKPALLSSGVKWKPVTITPEESQFLATRQYQRSEIAGLFRVPPHMIGDVERSTSWGTGIEEQMIGFVTFTLTPWLVRLEAALSRLLWRQSDSVKFNTDALLRGRTLDRFIGYVHARNAGWLSVNDIRALEDRPPVEGGDGYLQPLNMGPLGFDPTTKDSSGGNSDG